MTRIFLILCAVVAGVLPAMAQTPQASAPAPVVVTQGEAIIKRAPDRAYLSIATETRASKADQAREMNATQMTAVQRALRETGLPADAIRTTGFMLTPDMEWDNGRGTVRGYIVRNQIEVRVDDLTRLADVIDAANASRSTTLSIVGPRFGLKDEQAAEGEALRQAVQLAMTRAEAMAAGAKRTLGPIMRIEEQSGGYSPQPTLRMMRSEPADAMQQTPITPGEIEVRAVVILTVELR